MFLVYKRSKFFLKYIQPVLTPIRYYGILTTQLWKADPVGWTARNHFLPIRTTTMKTHRISRTDRTEAFTTLAARLAFNLYMERQHRIQGWNPNTLARQAVDRLATMGLIYHVSPSPFRTNMRKVDHKTARKLITLIEDFRHSTRTTYRGKTMT